MTRRQRIALAVAFVALIATNVATAVLASRHAVTTAVPVAVEKARGDLEAVAVASAQQSTESGRNGCERSQAGYRASTMGWTEARHRNRVNAADHALPVSARIAAGASAAVYRNVIGELKSLRVDCSKAWPTVNPREVAKSIRELAG